MLSPLELRPSSGAHATHFAHRADAILFVQKALQRSLAQPQARRGRFSLDSQRALTKRIFEGPQPETSDIRLDYGFAGALEPQTNRERRIIKERKRVSTGVTSPPPIGFESNSPAPIQKTLNEEAIIEKKGKVRELSPEAMD